MDSSTPCELFRLGDAVETTQGSYGPAFDEHGLSQP